jgi:hypothetical protein
LLVLGRKLESGNDELHANHDAAHALQYAQQGSISSFASFLLTSVMASR